MPALIPFQTVSDRARVIAVFGGILAITLLHLLSPQPESAHSMSRHGLHSALEGLYYLPILLAGYSWGRGPGGLTGVLVSLSYGVHTQLQLGGVLEPVNRGRLLALVIFPIVGMVTGLLADRLRRESTALVQAERQLRRAEVLAALGELSAGLAHEIRNPLTAIRGAAEVVASSVPPGSRDEEFSSLLLSEVERLDNVVTDFLAFARPGKEGEDCGDPLLDARATLKLVSHNAQTRSMKLVLDAPDDLPLVKCPPEALRQVLLNLCLNALRAMDAQGGGTLTLGISASGEQVQFHIDDTGPGVPEADRQRIFHPFVTGRDTGTGLGLSIVAKIVQQATGTVTVTDSPGGGARFAVQLPAAIGVQRTETPDLIG